MQRVVLTEIEFESAKAAVDSIKYTSFKHLPDVAFPLFLTSATYLRMLDGSLQEGAEFFHRDQEGALKYSPDDPNDPEAMITEVDLPGDDLEDEDDVSDVESS